jgi:hypothetical protein
MKHLLPYPISPEQATADEWTWYLLLQIGFPEQIRNTYPRRWLVRHDPGPAKQHLELVRAECKTLGIHVRPIDIRVGKSASDFAHYLFRFDRYRGDDRLARRVAEAVAYGMTLTSGLLADTDDPLVLPIPAKLVRGKRTITLDALIELEDSRPWRERTFPFPDQRIAAVSRTVTLAHEMAWKVAAVTLHNPALFDATRFLHRSHENFSVSPGGISEVMYDDEPPMTGASQNDFEDALHSAFKAIEAVIGDPPKDDRRFFTKLAQIGVDPHEEAGYREKIPIQKIIRRMNDARDKRAAHGSTRNRSITASELLEFQACADLIVAAAIEKVRGKPLRDLPPCVETEEE